MDAVFTESMKKTHTIVLPEMLEYHFPILKAALIIGGYKAEILSNKGASVMHYGKKYVNNDMCFPAISIIGQMIDSLEKGICDPDKTAFLLPQAGGACRAPNYYHLLKKALKNAGYPHVPVISLNLSGLNTQPGFKITPRMIKAAIISVMTGDLLMHLHQYVRPRAVNFSEPDELLNKWQIRLCDDISTRKIRSMRKLRPLYKEILSSFATIKMDKAPAAKIGIVGELYIKYCNIGNLDAEKFLYSYNCELKTVGFAVYALYIIQSVMYDTSNGYLLKKGAAILLDKLSQYYRELCDEVESSAVFPVMPSYEEFSKKSDEILSKECITGDGWLISAEACVLIEHGFDKIVCLNSFGCLVSHINCKGISGALRRKYPCASVTNIDCDPDTSLALYHSRLLMAVEKCSRCL